MTPSCNIDWQRCVREIRAKVARAVEIDAEIDESQGFSNRMMRGEIQEPRFSQGMRLLMLHRQLCGEAKSDELCKELP